MRAGLCVDEALRDELVQRAMVIFRLPRWGFGLIAQGATEFKGPVTITYEGSDLPHDCSQGLHKICSDPNVIFKSVVAGTIR